MSMWWTTKKLALVFPCVLALSAGVGCGDEGSGGSGGSAGSQNTGGEGGTGGNGGNGGNGGGTGGTGGMAIDTMTDPKNCGTIGNECAPGQTCAGGACTCGAASVAFADVQTILTAKCATGGCHSGAAPKAGLDLTAANAHAQLVNVAAGQCAGGMRMRVKPGEPSESYIIDKMMNVDKCSGNRMPPSTALPLDSIQTVSDWICGGALP